jgi:hypothetical protein
MDVQTGSPKELEIRLIDDRPQIVRLLLAKALSPV